MQDLSIYLFSCYIREIAFEDETSHAECLLLA